MNSTQKFWVLIVTIIVGFTAIIGVLLANHDTTSPEYKACLVKYQNAAYCHSLNG